MSCDVCAAAVATILCPECSRHLCRSCDEFIHAAFSAKRHIREKSTCADSCILNPSVVEEEATTAKPTSELISPIRDGAPDGNADTESVEAVSPSFESAAEVEGKAELSAQMDELSNLLSTIGSYISRTHHVDKGLSQRGSARRKLFPSLFKSA